MSGEPLVWRAHSHEAGEVARLLAAFRDWFDEREPTEEAIRESVGRLIEDPDTVYLLVGAAGEQRARGVCQLRFRHSVWTSAEDCWLEDLFIEGDARGAGLGRALVEAACETARERGARRIELDTNERNKAAIALYEACGFSAASKSHGPPLDGRDLFLGRRL